jgi:hypothetical protein
MKYAGLNLIVLLLSGLVVSGCAAVAAGTAGGVAADELTEDDGKFDPLENTDLGEAIYE